MDFLNKLLHRNSTSEGAASPPSGEARDSRSRSKSEIYLNNKNLNDAVSPSKTWTSGQLSEQKCEGQKTVQKEFEESYDYGEEEEQFEDAQENKLSLTLLADNLNRVHLTTPGRKEVERAVAHEFADDIVYRNESLNFNSSSFYESFDIKSGEQSLESTFLTTSITEASDSGDKTTTSSKISAKLTPSKDLDHTGGEYECLGPLSPSSFRVECSRRNFPIVTIAHQEETAQLNTLNADDNVNTTEGISKSIFSDLESSVHNSSGITAMAEEAKLLVTQSEAVFSEVGATPSAAETVDVDNSSLVKKTSNQEENVTPVEDRLEILNCDKTLSCSFESPNLSQSIVGNEVKTLVLTQIKDEEDKFQLQENAMLPRNVSLGIYTTDVMPNEEENIIQIPETVVLSEVSLGVDTSDVVQTKEEENTIQIEEKAVLPGVSLNIDTSNLIQAKEESTIRTEEKAVLSENLSLGLDRSDVIQAKEEENTIQIEERAVLQEVSLGVDTSDVDQTKEGENTIQIEEKSVLPEVSLGVDTSDVVQTKKEENTIQIQEKAVLPEVSLGVDTSDVIQAIEEEYTIQIQENAILPEVSLGLDTSDVVQTKEEESTIQIEEKAVLPEVSLEVDTSDVVQTKKEENTIQIEEKAVLPEVSLGVDTSDVVQTKEAKNTIQIEEKAVLPEVSLGVDTSDVIQAKDEENTIQIEEKAGLPELSLGVDTSDVVQIKELENTIQIEEKAVLPEVRLEVDTSDVVQTKKEENTIKIEKRAVLPDLCLGVDTSDVDQIKEVENTIQIEEKAVLSEVSLEVDTSDVVQTKKEENTIQIEEKAVRPEVSLGVDTSYVVQTKEDENTIQLDEKAVLPEVSLGVDTSDVVQTKKQENTIQIEKRAVLPEVCLGVDTSDVDQTKEGENTIQIEEKAVLPEVSLGVDTLDVVQIKEGENTIQIEEKAVLPEVSLGVDKSDVVQTKKQENTIQIQEKAVLPEVSLGVVDTSDVIQAKEEEYTIQIQENAVLPEVSLVVDTSDVVQTKEEENIIQIEEKAVLSEVSLGVYTSDVVETKKEENTIHIEEKTVLPEASLGVDTSDVIQTKKEENTIMIQEKAVLPEVSLRVDTSDAVQTKKEENKNQIEVKAVLPEVSLGFDTSNVVPTKKEENTIQIQGKAVLLDVSLGVDTSDVVQTKKEKNTIQIEEKFVLPEVSLGVDSSDIVQTKEEENAIQIEEKAVLPENVSLGLDTSDVIQTNEEKAIQTEEKALLSENVSLGLDTSDVFKTKEGQSTIQLEEKVAMPETVSLEIDAYGLIQTKEEENTIQIQEKAVLPEKVSVDDEVKFGSSTDALKSYNCTQGVLNENVEGSCIVTDNSDRNTSDAVYSKEKLEINMQEDVLSSTSETAQHFGGQKLENCSIFPTPNVTYKSENVKVEKPDYSIQKQTIIQYQDKFQTVKNEAVDLIYNKTPLPTDKIKERPVIMSEYSQPSINTTSVNINTFCEDVTAPANQRKCITTELKISPSKEKALTKFNVANASTDQFSNFKASPKRNLLNDFKASVQTSKENPVCEFFIAGENNSDALEFDERVAEEAANVSDHILNVSLELQESDSDSDNNKTVISLPQKQSPRLCDVPQPHPTRKLTQDSVFMLPFMQSMRSVLPVHLNQSEAGPITADELSTHDLEFQDGASLDLDYFNQVGSSDSTVQNSLTRHSLYVKFDPIVNAIVANTISDSIKMPPPSVPVQDKPSDEQPTSDQAAEPNAVEATVDSQKTPMRSPALEAVQKLISLTPPSSTQATTSPAKSDRGPVGTPVAASPKMAGISQEQLQKELKKLETIMKDREKHFEIVLSKKEEDLEAEAARRAGLEAELKASTERELRLKKEVQERTKSKQQLSLVMEEYEKTISQLVAQKEEDKKEYEIQKDILMKERDTAMQHLNNMEIAFSDVHQKYERSKSVIEGMKANEEMLRRGVAEYDEAVKSSNNRYESLKNHAVKQLETANTELDLTRRAHQAELAKLNAMMKKTDLRVKSLEESLERKTKENQELAAICDELINKVGN